MSAPPAVPETHPEEDDLVSDIEKSLSGIEFSREEINNVLDFFYAHSDALFNGQETYFILGSYKKFPIRRLRLVENQINRRLLKYGFLLVDLLNPRKIENNAPDDIPWTHCKFHLLAAYSTYMVLVIEGRHAGPSVELGEVTKSEIFQEKSYVLPRAYENMSADDVKTDVDVKNPYSQVQIDKFAIYERQGRCFHWGTKSDLVGATNSVLDD